MDDTHDENGNEIVDLNQHHAEVMLCLEEAEKRQITMLIEIEALRENLKKTATRVHFIQTVVFFAIAIVTIVATAYIF